MPLGHLIKSIGTSSVEARVKVTIKSMALSADASDKKFMVWLKRKGKSRGTALVRAEGCEVNWNESVTQTCTLLRSKGSGFLKSKRFNVVVIWNSCYEEAPGQTFGVVEVDLAESCGMNSYSLTKCDDPFAKIDLEIDCKLVDGGGFMGSSFGGGQEKKKSDEKKKKKGKKEPVGGFGEALAFYHEKQKTKGGGGGEEAQQEGYSSQQRRQCEEDRRGDNHAIQRSHNYNHNDKGHSYEEQKNDNNPNRGSHRDDSPQYQPRRANSNSPSFRGGPGMDLRRDYDDEKKDGSRDSDSDPPVKPKLNSWM